MPLVVKFVPGHCNVSIEELPITKRLLTVDGSVLVFGENAATLDNKLVAAFAAKESPTRILLLELPVVKFETQLYPNITLRDELCVVDDMALAPIITFCMPACVVIELNIRLPSILLCA